MGHNAVSGSCLARLRFEGASGHASRSENTATAVGGGVMARGKPPKSRLAFGVEPAQPGIQAAQRALGERGRAGQGLDLRP